MLPFIRRVDDSIQRLFEAVTVLVVAVIFVDVLWGVASRFLLRSPSPWTEEVARFLLIWVTFLGAAVGFGRQKHLGLDYFRQLLDPAAQWMLAVVGQVIILAFAATVLIQGGFRLVADTWAAGQVTPALQIRMGLVYAVVPLAGVAIAWHCVRRCCDLYYEVDHDADQSKVEQ